MAQHVVPITNGKGSKEIIDGNYAVTADVIGYNNASISPKQLNITTGVNQYNLTIAADGTLTLHVTDDGTDIGVPIEGATFYRCDSNGTRYGDMIETDVDGNALLKFVPYDGTNPPVIYFIQTGSDGSHTFDPNVQQTTMNNMTKTVEIANPDADVRNFTLTDANYPNLTIADGTITLTE